MDLIGFNGFNRCKNPTPTLQKKNIHLIHSNPITTNYFLFHPYILSLVDLLTRRPVDFF